MRVKWNRQLDGSLTRRGPADEAAPQPTSKEKECKQKGSPKFFRLFRRKKQRRRPDDGQQPDDASIYTPAPSEVDEDDCASVSSVASQPVTEVCHRDRTLSIFSSFRIGFPGGKKKKRPPLPVTDDPLSHPEKNRYSSPDLRKDGPEASASSPSGPVPGDFASLGELRAVNSQSFHQLRQDGETRLAKSVSFSDCQAGQAAQNQALPRTANGPVEEGPKASIRRKRLALACEASHSENKPTVADSGKPPLGCSAVQVPSGSETTKETNSRNGVDALSDLPGKWVKCDDTLVPKVQMPNDSVTEMSVANNSHYRVRNGDAKVPLTDSGDRPTNGVRRDAAAVSDTNGSVCKQYNSKLHFSEGVDHGLKSQNESTVNAELLPKISTSVNPKVKPSSELSDAKISATDTYVRSVNLPGTCVSISNFVEELAVRNAPKDNLFPVSVPDCSAFDTSNLNGSPSSGSANARLELSKKVNTHQVKSETSPESLDADNISTANCVQGFATRSGVKDTMLSLCEVNYPVHFVTEHAVECDPKNNQISVCEVNSTESGGHDDTLIRNANLNEKVIDSHSQSESPVAKGGVAFIKLSTDDVFNSERELSDPHNGEYINIHHSDHVARDSDNNLNTVPQVNEPDSRFSPTGPETICSGNDNENAFEKAEKPLELYDRRTPLDICFSTELPKEQFLTNILDYLSSENTTIGEIELLQKIIVTNCRECPSTLDKTSHCLDFIKGDHFLSSNINHYTITTCPTQQNDSSDWRKRSVLNLNHPFKNLNHPLNNNVESYLRKLIVADECSYLDCKRHLKVWNASFVQNSCCTSDLPLKEPDDGSDLDCVNDRPSVRGKQHQDRCPDASLPVLPSGSTVTLHGPDLHTEVGTDTPQYASDGRHRRHSAEDPGTTPVSLSYADDETPDCPGRYTNGSGVVSPEDSGYGRDLANTPAMLSDVSVGVYDGVFTRETYAEAAGEIRADYPRQIYDVCRYTDEGCCSGPVSPEISVDSFVSDGSSIQGEKHSDTETCSSKSSSPVHVDHVVLNGEEYAIKGYQEESSEKHSDTETSPSESSSPVHLDSARLANGDEECVFNGYREESSDMQSDIETSVSVGLNALESSPMRNNNIDACPVLNGYLEHSYEKYSDSKTSVCVGSNVFESSPLRDVTDVSNVDACLILNGYLEESSDKHSDTGTYESVRLHSSELSLQLDCTKVTNGGNCGPLINGYLEDLSPKHSYLEACGYGELSRSEPSSIVQQSSVEVAKAGPVINGHLGDSSGDESYVESLLLTGELTEELISTTLRTDTGLSGTLDEEEVSGTFSVTSDRDTTNELFTNGVSLNSEPQKISEFVSNENMHDCICTNDNENEIPYEGVKNKIKMFESNSPDVSLVTSAPDITVITTEEKLPQTRRKSADKGKNSLIPSLKKRRSNTLNEKLPEPAKSKKSASNIKFIGNKVSGTQAKRSDTKSQEGHKTEKPKSEKLNHEISNMCSETSFDYCIIKEVKSDYKCFNSSTIELVPDTYLLKTPQLSDETISKGCKLEQEQTSRAECDLNPPQNETENFEQDYKCFDDCGIERAPDDDSGRTTTQEISEKSEQLLASSATSDSNSKPPQNETNSSKPDFNCLYSSAIEHVSDSNLLNLQQISIETISEECKVTQIPACSADSSLNTPKNETENSERDYKCFNDSAIELLPDPTVCNTTLKISEDYISKEHKLEQILPAKSESNLQSEVENLAPDCCCVNDYDTDSVCLTTGQISEGSISKQHKLDQILPSRSEPSSQREIENLKPDCSCVDNFGNVGEVLHSSVYPTTLQIKEKSFSKENELEKALPPEFNSLSEIENLKLDCNCANDFDTTEVCPATRQIKEESISDRCKSEEVLASDIESDSNHHRSVTPLQPVVLSARVRDKDVFHLSSSLDDFDDPLRGLEGRSSNLTLSDAATGVQGQCGLQSRCASLPLVVGQVQSKERMNFARRNYLIKNKDVATCGRSRIPRKQAGARGAHPVSKPVRPPMWLSKAELTQEIQRLGNLCEARTKELNRLKMETKHVSVGFDAFAALFKYMVEDLNALSVPMLSADLQKTLKQLELAKQDLAYYEREVEEMKAHHCQELNDLSNKLFEVFQGEVTELSAKHQEEMNHLNHDHQTQIESLTASLNTSSAEAMAQQEELATKLQQELIKQREELQLFQEREIMDLEEKHSQSTKTLQEHIEQLQKKCAELKQHSMGMEDAMRKDTDSKLQWVTARKVDLEKEVESLKAVLEMKNKELHTIRVQNLEMEKQLEELPLAREKIKMLQARAEDLEALMLEKTKLERKLSTENHQIRETYEKESKVNRRLSMENEELQWRLRQAEQSLISGSFSEVLEYPEEEENGSLSPAKSPSKSPGPHPMSRSVFFTFVDKEDHHSSPKSQYKKITPGFSSGYKTSPAKSSSKSPPAPSPRRGKSHSEPPQPPILSSTPRKQPSSSKQKGTPKRQRSASSDCGKPNAVEQPQEPGFLSVTGGSMASSVSSESSVFEHKERYLEEHREQILHSLEILREQRNAEEPSQPQTPNDPVEDMSRSAELFSDPKTYYHMTFPVMKEAGVPEGGDTAEDGRPTHSKSNGGSSNGDSPSSGGDGVTSQVVVDGDVYVKTSNEDARDGNCEGQTEQNLWRTI